MNIESPSVIIYAQYTIDYITILTLLLRIFSLMVEHISVTYENLGSSPKRFVSYALVGLNLKGTKRIAIHSL